MPLYVKIGVIRGSMRVLATWLQEVGHSSKLIDHLLYLEGVPGVEHLDTVGGGRTVADLLKADLDFEREDVELLRKGTLISVLK